VLITLPSIQNDTTHESPIQFSRMYAGYPEKINPLSNINTNGINIIRGSIFSGYPVFTSLCIAKNKNDRRMRPHG